MGKPGINGKAEREFLKKCRVVAILIELIERNIIYDSVKTIPCYAKLIRHGEISELNRLAKQLLVEVY